MKRANVVVLDRDWWKKEREPSSQLIIKTKKQAKLASKYYTVKQFADRLAISVWCVYDLIRDGDLEAQPINANRTRIQYRISEEAIVEYLTRQTEKRRRG